MSIVPPPTQRTVGIQPFDWTCPFCGHDTTITSERFASAGHLMNIDNRDGPHFAFTRFIVCPNKECRRFTFTVILYRATTTGKIAPGGPILLRRLIPPSDAKVFPDYVPQPIRDDYEEACLIRDLSPKAAATLARRALQGMIRDFWNIKRNRLYDEIADLEAKVDPLTWKAIDAVRSVGNIGAHMEKDVNLVVDIEPGEAGLLLGLIETLIREWYIVRHEREERLKAIATMGVAKEKARTPTPEAEESAETPEAST
ncbi:MAG TPA: DUF4145 domain-containing protein [Candidatus Methylomirabilis sp.]|nr:DUF4145 domain-containing protein [Candidatus Methylomirabilis sp.]